MQGRRSAVHCDGEACVDVRRKFLLEFRDARSQAEVAGTQHAGHIIDFQVSDIRTGQWDDQWNLLYRTRWDGRAILLCRLAAGGVQSLVECHAVGASRRTMGKARRHAQGAPPGYRGRTVSRILRPASECSWKADRDWRGKICADAPWVWVSQIAATVLL